MYFPSDDSFLLVDCLKNYLEDEFKSPIPFALLDMGCGTGIISVFVKSHFGNACITAVDRAKEPITCTRNNLQKIQSSAKEKVEVLQGHLFEPLSQDQLFDIITFNPPYLPSDEREPARDNEIQQWDGGPTGIELTTEFLKEAPAHLRPRGQIFLIASSHGDLGNLNQITGELGYISSVAGKIHIFFEDIICYRLGR